MKWTRDKDDPNVWRCGPWKVREWENGAATLWCGRLRLRVGEYSDFAERGSAKREAARLTKLIVAAAKGSE